MSVTLRQATTADVPAMHAIRLAVRENRLADATAIGESSYLPYIEEGAAWVAVVGGRITGFAALDVAGAAVWALFVDPEVERLGIGRALLGRLVDEAARRQLTRLTLTTSPGTRAEQFYGSAGWTPLAATDAGEICFERAVTDAAPGRGH